MSKKATPPGLSSLLYPHTDLDFINQTWPKQPFFVDHLGESVAPLTSLPFLKSLDAMLTSWSDEVRAYRPGIADEANSVFVNATEAKIQFDQKMSLLFNDVQKKSPVLQEWVNAIHQDLGLPTMTYGRCMVYATPDGTGTAPHFDQNVNFVLQLTGIKKWWLAPNTTVDHPSQRHTMGLPMDPELASYVDEPMPVDMPTTKKSYILKPGSMLFVPQGYWHSTEAEGEALSLNFTYSQPSWVDLFTAALRSRLLLSPEWRSLADGVTSQDPETRQLACEKLNILLMELKDDLPHWEAKDILDATDCFKN